MFKRYAILLIFAILSIFSLAACSKEKSLPLVSPQQYSSEADYHEAILSTFIKTNLIGEYGVYTNYLDNEQAAEVATGHEVLSESSGLLLRYYAQTQQKRDFDALWKLTNETFNMETGFSYRYSPLHEKKYMINAAIDDLRLIRALFEASEAFKDEQYSKQAITFGQRFIDYNTDDDRMFDFYDETYQLTNQFISLYHINLRALTDLSAHLQLEPLVNNMVGISKAGYISDDFPFYETRYIYETGSYHSENINTIESLMTILSLAEINEHQEQSIAFIKEKVNNEELFGQYAKDGTALNSVQSTAMYALTAMLGAQLGDEELYTKSIELMERYLIKNKEHELFGSYANEETLQLYSFDNLQALLAYSYSNKLEDK